MTQPTPASPTHPGSAYFALPQGSGRRLKWWHWLLGLLAIIGLELALGAVVYGLAWVFSPADWQLAKGEGPRGGYADYLALFAVFIPSFVLPLLVWRLWNHLPLARLIAWAGRVRWGYMIRSLVVVAVGYALWTLADVGLNPEDYAEHVWHPDPGGFAVLLLITLLLCPIQASSEELLVRGYANHAVARWLGGSRVAIVLACVITSALFAALHLGNPEGEGQLALYMAGTFLFGLGMCALLWLEGGLESAIGYHIANNVFVFSGLGYADASLPQSALWEAPDIAITATSLAWEALGLVVFVALIVAWNRRADRARRGAP